ncbi:MAG TPA: chorismate synthase [Bacteroidia bacterium]|nr:chorismate synthase [Bacteroidia bacterium]
MAGNTFGKLFRLTSFGESHGPAIGGVLDGCPAGIQIDESLISNDLKRRKPGQSYITTSRDEKEEFEILSGILDGITLGSPIAFIIRNKDHKSSDYDNLKNAFRPSHADFTYQKKYGIRDYRGGGRSSARETAVRVFAGSIAKQLLSEMKMKFSAYVSQIGNIKANIASDDIDFNRIESSLVRCPDELASLQMIKHLEQLKKEGDTTGGIVNCLIQNVPIGLGEPVYAKLQADLSSACMGINAAHGFEYGSGFAGVSMRGSEHNDAFVVDKSGKITTNTNNSGGIQGGISNGMDIYFRVAFKPVSTIMKEQVTVDSDGDTIKLTSAGRHDPCVVPRAVPIVEAMAALVLADHYLLNRIAKI